MTLPRRSVACGSVEVTRRVVAGRGLSVALLSLSVTDVGGQIAVASFYVTLACRRLGILDVV